MKIIPFGKYKDQPIEILINDFEYKNWLLAQSWFVQKFPDLRTIIINNFKEPQETPEHNRIQGKFIDNKFCIQFLKTVFPQLFDKISKIPESDWRFKYAQEIKDIVVRKSFEKEGYDVYLSFDMYFKDTMDVFDNGEFNHLGSDNYETIPLKIEIKPTVSDDYPNILRQMKASKANILYLMEYTGVGISKEQFIEYFRTERIRIVFDSDIANA